VGTSNFGSFLNTASECLTPPLPTTTFDGVFLFDFQNGDALFGTRSSHVTLSGTPGLFNFDADSVVLGGTGRFSGAKGMFEEIGTLDARTPGTSVAIGDFQGTLTAAAIPEPASWAFMVAGIGAMGLVVRRRQMS
jgi:hypothetical protein